MKSTSEALEWRRLSYPEINRERREKAALESVGYWKKVADNKLLAPEKNRVKALADYHANNRNEDRRLRNAPVRKARELKRDLKLLDSVIQRLRRIKLRPKRTPEEKKVAKAVARRLDKWRKVQQRFSSGFKQVHTSSFIEDLCGISLQGLRSHLEAQFQPGMTWENYGFYGWHIDHIKPCSSFELDQKQVCFHYTNLQPLRAKDNLSKSDKI